MRTFVPKFTAGWAAADSRCRCSDCARSRGVTAEVRLAAFRLRERARAVGLPDAATLAEVEAAEIAAGIDAQIRRPVVAPQRTPTDSAADVARDSGSTPEGGTSDGGRHE